MVIETKATEESRFPFQYLSLDLAMSRIKRPNQQLNLTRMGESRNDAVKPGMMIFFLLR
jgi:hypothetical protein